MNSVGFVSRRLCRRTGETGSLPAAGNLIYSPRGVMSLCGGCGLQTSSPLQLGSWVCFRNRRLLILTTSRPILATGEGVGEFG